MELTYTKIGDYYYPNLCLPPVDDDRPLGKYGRLRKTYLKEHCTRFQLMRKAIDYAICMSNDMERFGKILLELGFVLRYDEKLQYPTIRSIDSKKAVRLWRLGEEYEIERIRQRIHERPLGVKYQSQFWYKEDRQKWRIKEPLIK